MLKTSLWTALYMMGEASGVRVDDDCNTVVTDAVRAEDVRDVADAAHAARGGERIVRVDLYVGEEPAEAVEPVESGALAPTLPPPAAAPLIAHPRADRRALVAAEVRVMLRDLAAHSVVASIGGRGGTDGARWRRTYDDVIALLEAGDVGNAHTVATQALYPAGASAGVSSVGQVRT